MKVLKTIRIILLQTLIVGSIFAQISREGTSAVNFLLIEPGSRAVGMGSAQVAVGGDSYAVYYNPAGLAQITSFEMDVQRTNWIADITYDYLSIAFPVHHSAVAGIQVISLSMADMEVRTELDQDGTGEMFSVGDLLLGTSLAITISDRFSVGGTFKYVREQIWHMASDGLAFDVGTRYSAPFLNTVIGVAISNFGDVCK